MEIGCVRRTLWVRGCSRSGNETGQVSNVATFIRRQRKLGNAVSILHISIGTLSLLEYLLSYRLGTETSRRVMAGRLRCEETLTLHAALHIDYLGKLENAGYGIFRYMGRLERRCGKLW
jgi:hypothetical protein